MGQNQLTRYERALRYLNRKVSLADREFDLLHEGDRVLVALSGGKDSLVMLEVLARRLAWHRIRYQLVACHVDSGHCSPACTYPDVLEKHCRALDVPLRVVKAEPLEPDPTARRRLMRRIECTACRLPDSLHASSAHGAEGRACSSPHRRKAAISWRSATTKTIWPRPFCSTCSGREGTKPWRRAARCSAADSPSSDPSPSAPKRKLPGYAAWANCHCTPAGARIPQSQNARWPQKSSAPPAEPDADTPWTTWWEARSQIPAKLSPWKPKVADAELAARLSKGSIRAIGAGQNHRRCNVAQDKTHYRVPGSACPLTCQGSPATTLTEIIRLSAWSDRSHSSRTWPRHLPYYWRDASRPENES